MVLCQSLLFKGCNLQELCFAESVLFEVEENPAPVAEPDTLCKAGRFDGKGKRSLPPRSSAAELYTYIRFQRGASTGEPEK